MKKELKKTVVGARCMLVLAGCAAVTLAVWLAREYPAALAAGAAYWAIGRALIQAEEWHLRRWKALKRLERERL